MSKHAFWQALVFTVIVFSLGIVLGFFLELGQSEKIYYNLIDSELNILDEQLRQRIVSEENVSCELAKESIFSFADKIYADAFALESADGTGRLTDLTVLHKRYDLLRTLLLLEAEKLKKRCGEEFHIVLYFYLYNTEDIEITSRQNYFSGQIFDLKLEYPEDIILIPIAVDTGVSSVELLVESRNVKNYPVIIVDGEKIIAEFSTLEQLKTLVFSSTNSP